MDYELAKKLKDAGFPQGTQWSFVDKEGNPKGIEHQLRIVSEHGRVNLLVAEYDLVSAPTLPELIEACGAFGETITITVNPDGVAWAEDLSGHKASGTTPEEAVSNLYLSLK